MNTAAGGSARDDSVTEEVPEPLPPQPAAAASQAANGDGKPGDEKVEGSSKLMLDLSKYILLLATLVATVTYAAAFSPPGGVWQETDDAAGHLAGDSIIRTTSKARYLAFYYLNATAFASSLVVIFIIFSLAIVHEKKGDIIYVKPLQAAMVLDLMSLMGAYAAGTCRDTVTTVYSCALVGLAFIYLVLRTLKNSLQSNSSVGATVEQGLTSREEKEEKEKEETEKAEKRLRKVLMLLATFAISVTYVAGMTTPGGFWDAGSGHPPGRAILAEGHDKRLTVFLCFNASAFFASLLIVVVLLDKKPPMKMAYGCITVALVSLVVAYTAGSCRQTDTTVYVSSLVGAVLAFILLLQHAVRKGWTKTLTKTCFWRIIEGFYDSESDSPGTDSGSNTADKASSLVLLLATLAATITYQAGLSPPGGVWPDDEGDYMAGDPILLSTNPRRFKAFFYCNSIAFVASLVSIILVQSKPLLKTHVLEAAMILDVFGLIGAYAAGSCRDVSTSIYAMALAGAVLVYVVVHIVFFTLNHTAPITDEQIVLVEKRRKRLLLFAVLAATITYQAGLTPPGGFRLEDDGSSSHNVGDPVLLYNFPRRYTAFFYCNSVSFMLSIALIILLVNPHLYRPAIRSYALTICMGAGMLGLMGAYAAGSTQHLKTSIYIFVLVGVVFFITVGMVLHSERRQRKKDKDKDSSSKKAEKAEKEEKEEKANNDETEKAEKEEKEEKARHAKRKYLMLLGILVASVTYQAGLSPPGGTWQSDSDSYNAGDPVMHVNRRPRYLVFFYSNSASFVASILVIVLLLTQWSLGKKQPSSLEKKKHWSLKVMNTAIFLDLLALLGAYAAGSSRGWKTSMYVVALIAAVLAYVAAHIMLALSCVTPQDENVGGQGNASQSHDQTNGGNQTPPPAMSQP